MKARMRGFEAEVDRVICPSTVTGLSCGVGCARIGVFPKRNSRSTWDSLSSCTTSASEAKRCCLHSLSSWSRKTLESNKSVLRMLLAHVVLLGIEMPLVGAPAVRGKLRDAQGLQALL